MDWGTTWSGRCLTQRPTFPKAASRSYLSDILETHVPNKYFLSLDRLQHLIRNLLNINPSNRGMGGQVYGPDGVAPTLTGDEGIKIALSAKDGISVAGLLPGNFEQGNRVYDVSGTVPTLSTKQGRTKIMIRKNETKYQEVKPGDSVNLAFPNSKSRRGRLGKQSVHTLLTGDQQAVVTDQYQIRKLTPRECWRLQGFPDWAFDRASQVNSDSQLYKQAGNSVTVPVIFDIARRLKEIKTYDI